MLKRWGLLFFSKLVRWGLSLRYRVKIEGLESLSPQNLNRGAGTLFLPNHPAEIDPILLSALLWKQFQPRPLVVSHFYYLKLGMPFMKLVRALPIPNMELVTNHWKLKQMEKAYESRQRPQFRRQLPHLSRRQTQTQRFRKGRRRLHGAQPLQDCPNINVVLIRTTGLWGSSFSRALAGSSPDFGGTLQGLKNHPEERNFFHPPPQSHRAFRTRACRFPRSSRLALNQYFEAWFNQYPKPGPEPLALISYSFWKEDLLKFPRPKRRKKSSRAEHPSRP